MNPTLYGDETTFLIVKSNLVPRSAKDDGAGGGGHLLKDTMHPRRPKGTGIETRVNPKQARKIFFFFFFFPFYSHLDILLNL